MVLKKAIFGWILGFLAVTSPLSGESASLQVQMEQVYRRMQQSEGGVYATYPHLTKYVSGVGERLAKVSDSPHLPFEFVVLSNMAPNAWSLPTGKIAINLGLLFELGSEAELAAVLSHEIAHAAREHAIHSMQRNAIGELILGGLDQVLPGNVIGMAAKTSAVIGNAATQKAFSREDELEADAKGIRMMAKAGYDPYAAVALQKTFLRLSKGRKENRLTALFATHPPSEERVKANERSCKRYNHSGKKGFSEYDGAMKGIRKEAYLLLEKGDKALDKGKASKALDYADRGLALEPNEGRLYLLKADAEILKKRYREALAAIDKAIELNPHYYDYYATRAFIHEKLGNTTLARSDSHKSQELLPP